MTRTMDEIIADRAAKNEQLPPTEAQKAYIQMCKLIDPDQLDTLTKASASRLIDDYKNSPIKEDQIKFVRQRTMLSEEDAAKYTQGQYHSLMTHFMGEKIGFNEQRTACTRLGKTPEEAVNMTRRDFRQAMKEYYQSLGPEAPTPKQMEMLDKYQARGIDVSDITTKDLATKFIGEQIKIDNAERELRKERASEPPTPKQVEMLEKYQARGIDVSEVTTKELAKKFISEQIKIDSSEREARADRVSRGRDTESNEITITNRNLPSPFVDGKLADGTPYKWAMNNPIQTQNKDGSWDIVSITSQEIATLVDMLSTRTARIQMELGDVAYADGRQYWNQIANTREWDGNEDMYKIVGDFQPSADNARYCLARLGYSTTAQMEDPRESREWEILEKPYLNHFKNGVQNAWAYAMDERDKELAKQNQNQDININQDVDVSEVATREPDEFVMSM